MQRTVNELRTIASNSQIGAIANGGTEQPYTAMHDALQLAARASRQAPMPSATASSQPPAGSRRPPSMPGRRQNPRAGRPATDRRNHSGYNSGGSCSPPSRDGAAANGHASSEAAAAAAVAEADLEASRHPIDWGRRAASALSSSSAGVPPASVSAPPPTPRHNHLETGRDTCGGFHPALSVPLDALSDGGGTSYSQSSEATSRAGQGAHGPTYRQRREALMRGGAYQSSAALGAAASGAASSRAGSSVGGSPTAPSAEQDGEGRPGATLVDYRANAARLVRAASGGANGGAHAESSTWQSKEMPKEGHGPVPIDQRPRWADSRAPMAPAPPAVPHPPGILKQTSPQGAMGGAAPGLTGRETQQRRPSLGGSPLSSTNSSPTLRQALRPNDWAGSLRDFMAQPPEQRPTPVERAGGLFHHSLSEPDMTQANLVADHGLSTTIDVERRQHARELASACLRKWVDYCTQQLRTSALHLRCDIHYQAVRLNSLWQYWRRETDIGMQLQRRVLACLLAAHGADVSAAAAHMLRQQALFWMTQV